MEKVSQWERWLARFLRPVQTLSATYGAATATLEQTSTGTLLVGHAPYWDTQDKADYSMNNRLYPSEAQVTVNGAKDLTQFVPTNSSQPQTATITTGDAPFVSFPRSWGPPTKGAVSISSVAILWNFIVDVVGVTDESASTYVGQASTAWVFAGSGNFDNNATFTATNAKVTFTTNQWQPATANSAPLTVSDPRFNQIVKNDYALVPG